MFGLALGLGSLSSEGSIRNVIGLLLGLFLVAGAIGLIVWWWRSLPSAEP
jgi:hypothetical protein